VIDAAKARGAPYRAHNLLGHARRLFNWAIARRVYGIDRSPCDRMVPSQVIGPKRVRDRILTDEELRAVWNAAQKMGYPNGPLIQLLILTGQRRGEIAGGRWAEIDLAALLWRIPASRMKAGAAHVLPLTQDVVREKRHALMDITVKRASVDNEWGMVDLLQCLLVGSESKDANGKPETTHKTRKSAKDAVATALTSPARRPSGAPWGWRLQPRQSTSREREGTAKL
jgi:integrase